METVAKIRRRRLAETPDPGYHLVTIADKLHNARAILLDCRVHGDALWERFDRTDPAEHLWYDRGLADAFRVVGLAPPALIGKLASSHRLARRRLTREMALTVR